MSESKTRRWIRMIAYALEYKSDLDTKSVEDHIKGHFLKHCQEITKAYTDGVKFSKWMASMQNLIFIANEYQALPEHDWDRMYERLQNHAAKKVPYNVLENGEFK